MKRLLIIFVLSMGVFLISQQINVADAAPKVINWRFVCDYPAGDLGMDKAVPKLAKWIEEASEGRMRVTVYSGNQLVSPQESFDNLKAGTFQLLQTFGAYHAGKVPVANPASSLPMGCSDYNDYLKLYANYGVFNLMSKAYGEAGVHFMAPTPYSGANIMSKVPIRTLEDFKGKKIRTSGYNSDMMKAAGASPIYITGGELYLALQTGVVDGATWSNYAIEGMKFHEVTKYMICGSPYPPGSSFPGAISGVLLANEKAFQSLPSDLQEIVVRCVAQYSVYTGQIYKDWDEWFLFKGGAVKFGVEPIVLPQEDINTLRDMAINDIWPGIAKKDENSAKYIEALKRYIKDKGEIK